MACFYATLVVIALLGCINLSAADKDTVKEFYAVVGQQSLTLPFVYKELTNSHVLRWTHNRTIIFYRQQGRVSVGKSSDISTTGSFFLRNLAFSSSGLYEATVLHPNGTAAIKWTGHLFVMSKVSKPRVTYVCDATLRSVNLNCYVDNPQGLVFSWTLDKKVLTGETRQTLSLSLPLQVGSHFMCSVANKVSSESSDAVLPACKNPSLLCLSRQTFVSVLAGVAGLIFVLLIIIFVLCCRHRHNKAQKNLGDKEDLRMLSLSKRVPDSTSPVYETMHHVEKSETPSPQPSPRVRGEIKSAQLSTAAEGQQPSPVPKPRSKNALTPNI
ncbi:SLAM family member 9-like [Mugil cephalus]|uniref:SLAM family member 9-like n=1 Tax=Mugil cephalus TaxID=48193 RepID=UPI001FB7FB8A|nr:SLAM family member 9-like [Mugil cephalus]